MEKKSEWGPVWASQPTVWFPTLFKIIFFCVQQKIEIHGGLEQPEGE